MPDNANNVIEAWLSALRHSHSRLSEVAAPLTVDELMAASYASEWSIAQVLSHLGSGAEIFELFLRAGVAGNPAPGLEQFQVIWDRWNAKAPEEQAADGLSADAALVDGLVALDAAERMSWRVSMFGAEQGLADLLRFRLGEHALHTWDIAVARDERATVAPDAADLLVDTLGDLVERVGKTPATPLRVQIATEGPSRRFLLESDSEGTHLRPLDDATTPGSDGVVKLPAEALVRLVYGRLDAGHTPALTDDGDALQRLRSIFPGF